MIALTAVQSSHEVRIQNGKPRCNTAITGQAEKVSCHPNFEQSLMAQETPNSLDNSMACFDHHELFEVNIA